MIGLNRRPVNGTSHDLSMRMHVLLRKIQLLEKMIFYLLKLNLNIFSIKLLPQERCLQTKIPPKRKSLCSF